MIEEYSLRPNEGNDFVLLYRDSILASRQLSSRHGFTKGLRKNNLEFCVAYFLAKLILNSTCSLSDKLYS
ncbi:hypothetical protein L0337_40415, partial [candidate division KSB1 bacterium]|nr:hypothetical protein [candidate division KSB1 bacterium]